MEKRTRREFTKEFKQQMVSLQASGKSASEIIHEYELIALRKQNKQLLMENDILKQAALIMGRK